MQIIILTFLAALSIWLFWLSARPRRLQRIRTRQILVRMLEKKNGKPEKSQIVH